MVKADFSIIKNIIENDYRRVLLQQGRVLTDSDINEYQAIIDQLRQKYLRDIIGEAGVPYDQKEHAFKIDVIENGTNRFSIGKGTIYVEGIPVINRADSEGFSSEEGKEQPYLPSLFRDGKFDSPAVPQEQGIYLAYLDVWERLITDIQDPTIKEVALGGADTSVRSQLVWQVKLHKLVEGEEPIIDNENHHGDNTWAEWIELKAGNISQLLINETANDGRMLELFINAGINANNPDNQGRIFSRKELELEPVKWAENWELPRRVDNTHLEIKPIKIALEKNSDDLLEMHAIWNGQRTTAIFLRNQQSKWSTISQEEPLGFVPSDILLGKNKDGTLYRFVLSSGGKVFHSKQKSDLSGWQQWQDIDPNRPSNINKIKVISNHQDVLELFAINANDNNSVWSAKQKDSNETSWSNWNKIIDDNSKRFSTISVGLNNKKQVVIFAVVSQGQSPTTIWTSYRENFNTNSFTPWTPIGADSSGVLRSDICVMNNPKKQDRLELFCVFSEPGAHTHGKIWNIYETETSIWKTTWKAIEGVNAVSVYAAIDDLSRINVFAIDSQDNVQHTLATEKIYEIDCNFPIPSWESKTKHSSLKMAARTVPQSLPNDRCLLPPRSGYKRLENQLYRIEIHNPRTSDTQATYKFSRDNGFVCARILDISGEKIKILDAGRDTLNGFSTGQWIEITDDRLDLWEKPGIFAYITELQGSEITIDRATIIPEGAQVSNESFPSSLNPKIRRWDSHGLIKVALPSSNDGFIPIEDGIEIKFSNPSDNHATGDYWTIPARTITTNIEWPVNLDGSPRFLNREGVSHYYAKLALLKYEENALIKLADCRHFFSPLTSLQSGSLPQENPQNPQKIRYWVHGNLAKVQHPERLSSGGNGGVIVAGSGITFVHNPSSSNTEKVNYFHFPISLAYPYDDLAKKTILNKVFVLFKSLPGVEIKSIQIFDGRSEVLNMSNLLRTGDHGGKIDEFNTFEIQAGVELSQSLGISIEVDFNTEGQGRPEITFNGVGVELSMR